MADFEPFTSQTDYTVPLLRLLSELPDGQGRASEVRRLFGEEYGHLIPTQDHGVRRRGEIIWENNVAWSRNHLKGHGLLDAPAYGVWRITDAGRQWLQQNPNATRIKGKARRTSPKSRRKPSKTSAAPGITLEMLEQTRKLMPADQFRQVWGALYDQLLAEEQAKAITRITQPELGRRTRRWLDEVHAFLSGKGASIPSSEVLCDWIHLCYTVELHREAAALLPYVHEDEVEPATYKRAKRVAEVCRSRLAG